MYKAWRSGGRLAFNTNYHRGRPWEARAALSKVTLLLTDFCTMQAIIAGQLLFNPPLPLVPSEHVNLEGLHLQCLAQHPFLQMWV